MTILGYLASPTISNFKYQKQFDYNLDSGETYCQSETDSAQAPEQFSTWSCSDWLNVSFEMQATIRPGSTVQGNVPTVSFVWGYETSFWWSTVLDVNDVYNFGSYNILGSIKTVCKVGKRWISWGSLLKKIPSLYANKLFFSNEAIPFEALLSQRDESMRFRTVLV